MPTIDMYGRNPNVEHTTFTYPYALVSDQPHTPPPGAVFFFKPPESSPVIGAEPDRTPNAEDTTVLVDPTNVYNQRMYGLGDISMSEVRDQFAQQPQVRTQKRAEARSWIGDAVSDMGAFYKRSSGPAQLAMTAVAVLIGWNVLKRVGR